MTRREFSMMPAAAGLAAARGAAQTAAGGNYPLRRRRKVEVLFQSPEGHPNGLEASEDGLWVGEQVTDRVHLLDWESGKPLVSYETQSSNTSGLAAGNGLLFAAANGPAKLRPRRPHDVARGGRIVKMDARTGKHIKNFQTPSGGGLHGLLWAKDFLWITQFNPNKILKADADINVFHDFDAPLPRAHGLGWDGEFIWCMFSNDFRILRFDIRSGRIVEGIQLDSSDPDPHGMTWWKGNLYYCDAGIAPGHKDSKSRYAGAICRIHA